MPVHFKTQSEYRSHYKTFQSSKSSSFDPTPEQAAPAAGQSSTKLGHATEPPMQSKKRTAGPGTTLGVDYYDSRQSQGSDYALLGANDKFVPNIKYKYKSQTNARDASPPKQQKLSQKQKQEKRKENIRPSRTDFKPPPVVNTEIYQQPPTPLAPRRPKYESDVSQTKDFSLENMNKQESITKAELKDKNIYKKEQEVTEDTDKQELYKTKLSKDRVRHSEKGDLKRQEVDKTAVLRDKQRQDKDVDLSKQELYKKTFSKEKLRQNEKPETKVFKKPTPGMNIKDIQDNMNEFVQTNLDKGVADSAPEAPAEYAMKYKAGVAPPRPRKKFSEYQKQFTWKDGSKSSPMLDAEQIIYKSNTNISPTKKDVVPKVSEYRTQFKEWKYRTPPGDREQVSDKPRKRSKVRRSKSMGALSPDRMPPAGSSPVVSPDNKRLTKEYEEQELEKEPVPKISHGKMKKVKTEYDANFKAPWRYSYDQGAWRGANPPHLQSSQGAELEDEKPALSNWFAEVIELRRKAAEYRKRAQGTHFSREHVVQLMAKQAEMWDAVSSRSGSSTLSALSLESGLSARARKQQRLQDDMEKIDEESARATMATEDDNHGSDKDFGDYNNNAEKYKKREKFTTELSKTRSVDTAQQEKRSRRLSREKKARKQAWTDSKYREPDSPASQSVDYMEDEDDDAGRIPTPTLKSETKKTRHHLDLTTPCTGGAILTSPPPARRQVKSAPVSKSWPGPVQDVDEDSDDTLEPPSPPLSGQLTFDVRKGSIKATPTFGMPSRDSHFLRDDDESIDRPMTTTYMHSPIKLKIPPSEETEDVSPQKPRRSSKFNQKSRSPDIPSTVQEGFGQTYNKPANLVWSIDGGLPVPRRDADDDVLSVSARSVASSCSLASETLERARKRKEEFWGKNGIAAR